VSSAIEVRLEFFAATSTINSDILLVAADGRAGKITERNMRERKVNPESEAFFDSPHFPFYHLLFYTFGLRPKAALGEQS